MLCLDWGAQAHIRGGGVSWVFLLGFSCEGFGCTVIINDVLVEYTINRILPLREPTGTNPFDESDTTRR